MKQIFKILFSLLFLLILTACLKEESYTVNFYNDDLLVETYQFKANEKIIPYKLDEREGFDYYWATEDNNPFDFANTVKENLNLYAVWNKLDHKYIIRFLNEDGVLIEELLVNYKDKIAPIIVEERNGYFYSWLKDGIPYNFNQEIKSNITLKLTWFEEVDSYNLDTYYLNDTHGAVLKKDEELGLSYIGNYIKEQYKNNPLGSLFIAGGDMFQGQLISNDNKGALMVEIFNELNLDAFVIGNHEFDWGLETILKYFDPLETGIKANFPILGANVVEKATNARPDFIDSHVIIKRQGLKIGIIGVIGDNLESSIATLRVKDYYFSNAYQAVVTTANEIKNDVDIILVVNHHNDQNFNNRVSSIDKVSAVFNGHTHSTYTGLLDNKIPYIQSGSNGKYVGNVKLEFDKYKNLTNGIAKNIKKS